VLVYVAERDNARQDRGICLDFIKKEIARAPARPPRRQVDRRSAERERIAHRRETPHELSRHERPDKRRQKWRSRRAPPEKRRQKARSRRYAEHPQIRHAELYWCAPERSGVGMHNPQKKAL